MSDNKKVSQEKFEERAAFFEDIALAMYEDSVLPKETIILRRARLPVLTKGYFLLSESYKGWRIEPGHYTELPKIAALQSLAIATFQPFRPIDPQNANTTAEARCNEIYALACAAATIKQPIGPNRPNFYFRILDILSKAQSDTIEPYIVDVNLEIDREIEEYLLPFSEKDKLISDSLITIFELFSNHYD